MFLQEDVAVGPLAEVLAVLRIGILGLRDEVAELLGVAIVGDDEAAVEPVFDLGALRDHVGVVEFADAVGALVLGGRLQVVERGDRAVAIAAELGVRVDGVVEHLELQAEGRAGALVEVGLHEVFQAAVSARGELEVDGHLEFLEALDRDDVAGVGGFLAVTLGGAERTLLDGPAGLREVRALGGAPALAGAAVEEELPTVGLLGLGQAVVWDLRERDIAPFDNGAGLGGVLADAVDLEGDEAGAVAVVPDVDALHAVEPGADAIAVGFDLHVVPFAYLGDLATLLGEGEGVTAAETRENPTATAFFVEASGPHTGLGGVLLYVLRIGVDLGLVAVDASDGHLGRLTVATLVDDFLGFGVAAELHARVQARVVLEIILQDEVRVILLGREEGVRRVERRGADEGAFGVHGVGGVTAELLEAREVLAVEDLDFVGVGLRRAGGGLGGGGLGVVGAADDQEGGGREAQEEQGLFHGVLDLV